MKSKSSECVCVSISLPRDLRDRARRIAFEDNRSLSGLLQILLQRHLESDNPQPVSEKTHHEHA